MRSVDRSAGSPKAHCPKAHYKRGGRRVRRPPRKMRSRYRRNDIASATTTSARQCVAKINPLPEKSEMADRRERMSVFPAFKAPGGFILATAALIASVGCGPVSAQENGPCAQIQAACTDAGFKQGSAKEGFGLVMDCIRPVMQDAPQRAKAAKPLPQIDAKLIAACKATNPNFGQRKANPSRSSGADE
jgi:hypothetical protein